jgi:hypothetical protein
MFAALLEMRLRGDARRCDEQSTVDIREERYHLVSRKKRRKIEKNYPCVIFLL